MELNKIYKGSCFDLIKDIPDNFVDLVFTSPPYSNTKSYGDEINVFHPDNYVDWLLPLFKDIHRVIKDSGSVIFNVDDKCVNKLRHPYIFDLILRVNRETNLKLYDYYIWSKKSFLPNGGPKRLNHSMEWLLHFVKDENKVKWNMDNVREPYSESSIKRFKGTVNKYKVDENGVKTLEKQEKSSYNEEKGKVPTNILQFNTGSATRGNKHPAPFHKDMPSWFIKALTDKDDIVLDTFIGSGTTACAAIELIRNWIGFELNQEYIDMAYEYINKELKKISDINKYKQFFGE